MRILQHGFRVYVDHVKLEDTIAFYEGLLGITCERRVVIAETGVTAAKVGAILILSGSDEQLAAGRAVDGIFYVDDVDETERWLHSQEVEIIHGLRDVTGGRNLTARHADGLILEYFEARA